MHGTLPGLAVERTVGAERGVDLSTPSDLRFSECEEPTGQSSPAAFPPTVMTEKPRSRV